jgi:hypothetical protein
MRFARSGRVDLSSIDHYPGGRSDRARGLPWDELSKNDVPHSGTIRMLQTVSQRDEGRENVVKLNASHQAKGVSSKPTTDMSHPRVLCGRAARRKDYLT